MQNAKLKAIVFLNGKFIFKHEAKTSVFDPGFLYGWGLFETMRAYHGNIVYFKEHLQRLTDSSRLIDIPLPYSLAQIKSAILKTIALNQLKDAYVRLTLWRKEKGSGILLVVRPYRALTFKKYRQGFRLTIASLRQSDASFLCRIKSLNYLFYQLAYQEAKARGFDEAVILNQRGYLCECSRANIFCLKDKTLLTPALNCGCLGGITRKVVFDLARKSAIKIYEGKLTVEDLKKAEGAFLTNSLLGIMPVTYLDKTPIGKGKPDNLTLLLMSQYRRLLTCNSKR